MRGQTASRWRALAMSPPRTVTVPSCTAREPAASASRLDLPTPSADQADHAAGGDVLGDGIERERAAVAQRHAPTRTAGGAGSPSRYPHLQLVRPLRLGVELEPGDAGHAGLDVFRWRRSGSGGICALTRNISFWRSLAVSTVLA